MKKALSVLLTLALALSLAVCAFAAQEPPEPPARPGASRFQDFAPAQAEPGTKGLTFELPVVTGITAVWDGNPAGLFDGWYGPNFTPESVAVTVSFEEGEPETLDHWWDEGYGWYWEVFYDYDDATGMVTFYYSDSNLQRTYYDSDGKGYIWSDYLATLPQASFTIPAGLLEEYLKNLPKTELKLDVSEAVTLDWDERMVFSFTPEKDGLYYFYSKNQTPGSYAYATLANDAFGIIAHYERLFDRNFDLIAELQAGRTYYLLISVYNYGEGPAEFDVSVSSGVRRIGFLQKLEYLFAGGWFRWRWVEYYGESYAISGRGTWAEIAKYNLASEADSFLESLEYILNWIRWNFLR